ncbi:MAG: class I SAM-dependent methyltransferase, partial [Crocinitomicaceae bacterium]
MENEDYLEKNKLSWNRRTEVHVDSEFYDNESFINGRSSLNSIELELLGDLAGKKILHLQCHFGQDTISLSRMGAEVVGIDLSDEAIRTAQKLATKTGQSTKFVCCDVYDLPNHLTEKFDIVFTSYGTIGWLPDLDKWANVVQHFLRPGGEFIFAEFHPVVWMFDDDFT